MQHNCAALFSHTRGGERSLCGKTKLSRGLFLRSLSSTQCFCNASAYRSLFTSCRNRSRTEWDRTQNIGGWEPYVEAGSGVPYPTFDIFIFFSKLTGIILVTGASFPYLLVKYVSLDAGAELTLACALWQATVLATLISGLHWHSFLDIQRRTKTQDTFSVKNYGKSRAIARRSRTKRVAR